MAPFSITADGKSARGYGLAGGKASPPQKAIDILLMRDITVAEGFRRITESALGHLLANRAAALSGMEEGIHQMRVAVRRLRADLALFKPCLEPGERVRFEGELRRIGRVFGKARDWDVFCIEILPRMVEISQTAGGPDSLREAAELRRTAAHAEFATECCAPPFAAVVLGLAGWASDGRAAFGQLGNKDAGATLAAKAPQLLDILADKVDRLGRDIDRASETELHALRKSLKKLRYGIEFLSSLFPHKRVAHYRDHCESLQKVLGVIQDAAMAVDLAKSLTDDMRPGLTPAISSLCRRLENHKQDSLHDLDRSWRKFHGERRFWS